MSPRNYPCLACGRITARRIDINGCPPAPFCSPECDPPPEECPPIPPPQADPCQKCDGEMLAATTPTEGDLT